MCIRDRTLSLSCVVAFPNNIFSELVRLRRDLDEKQKSEIVNRHNALRAKEGAANMELMSWDDKLESHARKCAALCQWEPCQQLSRGEAAYKKTKLHTDTTDATTKKQTIKLTTTTTTTTRTTTTLRYGPDYNPYDDVIWNAPYYAPYYPDWKWSFATSSGPEHEGQNLYAKYGNSDVMAAIQVWYEEKNHYDYDTPKCAAKKTCGNYTQMVWYTSRQIGCAVHHCDSLAGFNKNAAYFICLYHRGGNVVTATHGEFKSSKPYIKGAACSQCSSGFGWCKYKLCNSNCTSAGAECSCAAHCYNCGTLNIDTCRCKCANGWRGVDCSMRMYSKPDAVEGLCPPVYGPGAHTPTTTASAQSTFIVAQQAMITVLMVLVVLVINHNTATDQI